MNKQYDPNGECPILSPNSDDELNEEDLNIVMERSKDDVSAENTDTKTSGMTSGNSTPGVFRKVVTSGEVSFIKNRVQKYNENVIYSNIKKYFTKWKRMARGTGKRGKSKPIVAIDPRKEEVKITTPKESSTQNAKLVNQRVLKGHEYEHVVPTELFRFIDGCNDVYRIKDQDNNDK